MLRQTKTWDVRCPQGLARMFPRAKRKGYYYKVDREQAQEICRLLSKEYGVPVPKVQPNAPPDSYGAAQHDSKSNKCKIWVQGRGHMKTVFHEWYHTLEWYTNGKYDSHDNRGGPSSLAWQFADRMFDALRSTK